MWNPFKRKSSAPPPPPALDEEHMKLRRAIEHCDALRPAYEAKQLTLHDLIGALERDDCTRETIRRAIAECLGDDAAAKV